jgi:uncharacterized protein YndB with AHSA1/START domain
VDNDRTLVIVRTLDAPRELVFAAWTDPARGKQWMAPAEMSVADVGGELRPGGAWRLDMRRESGESFRVRGVYREIVPPEKLVFTHAWLHDDGSTGHETLVTVTFEALGAQKTRMTFRQAEFESVEDRDGHREGWGESFDNLETLVAQR